MNMAMNYYILAVFILIALYKDVRYSKIPNWLTVSGVFSGIGYFFIVDGFPGFFFSALGAVVSTAILLLLYLFKGVGAGDVKLFAAIGAITGMEFSLYSMMYSILFAGLIAILLLLYRRKFVKRMVYICYTFIVSIFSKDKEMKTELNQTEIVRFPFMYAVFPGVIATVYLFY